MKRPTKAILAAWLARGFFAALAMATLDLLIVLALGPLAASDALGFVSLCIVLVATYLVYVVPLSLLFASLDGAFDSLKSEDVPALLTTTFAIVAAALGIVELARRLAAADIEFPERTDLLLAMAAVAFAAIVAVMTRFAVLPAARWVFARTPHLAKPSVAAAALALGACMTLEGAAMFALAPVHLNRLAGLAAVGAMGCFLAALRWMAPHVTMRVARVTLALAAVLAAASVAACRHPHAQFVLRDRSLAAGALAGILRDAADVDRDGASATWLGGADCAEGNASIGPAEREVLGDGIDQDCRGGDAVRAAPRPPSTPLVPACLAPGVSSILLVTLDAVRAEVVSPAVTPTLARLSEDAFTFTRAYAQAPSTLHSVASLFTGRALSDIVGANPILSHEISLGAPVAERFRRAGFRTAAFNFFDLPAAYLTGFEREPALGWRDVNPRGIKYAFGSAQVTNAAIRFAASTRGQRFFAWLHYPDAHAPYLDTGAVRPELSPYEREVAYVDFHFGRLLAELERSGALDTTVLVVTADHGEDLGQGGREGHGPSLFERTIRVPLLVRIPGCAPSSIDEPVGLGRIAPTLAAIAGISLPGRSLFLSRDENAAALPVVSEALVDGGFMRAVVGPRHKMIVDVRNGGRVLFDLEADPGEQRDIYKSDPRAASEAEARYQRWLDREPAP
jgi:arylsulfatase A-like enzyme